jgi:uncharacterized protein (TIGR02594 family)
MLVGRLLTKLRELVFPGPDIKPIWITVAEGELGVKERSGPADNPRILEYEASCDLKHAADSIPWCSYFMNWVMRECKMERSNSGAARSWLAFGVQLPGFKKYSIVVLKRGKSLWQGHVAFAIRDDGDTILCLGGNMSDEVRYSSYPKKDVLGYRWPRLIKT